MRLLACFALGALLIAATPASASKACGGPCQQLPPSCGYDNYCTGGGGGDPCSQCKAACTSKYTTDISNCTLTGPAATDCVAVALNKMNECLIGCTIDNLCQDA